jgi:mannosyltransferase
VLGAVLLIGVTLRLYRFDAQKLWFDELYTAELARRGLDAIWRNSFLQLTPPLPYLLFWVGAQIGGLSALGLRLVSGIAAIIALPIYYRYCSQVADRWTALLATGLLGIAPLAVYYAQEARPYALALLALLLTLLAFERVRRRGQLADWGIYALLAAIAGQLHYVNVILVGAQLVALLLLAQNRRRVLIGGAGVVLAVAAALGPFMLAVHSTGREWAGWQVPQATLSFTSTLQTMVAGDRRIAPEDTRIIALAVVAIGVSLAVIARRNWTLLLPHVLQIAFALLVAFVLLPLAGVPAPAYEERPFLLILPSVLFCFSLGVRQLAEQRLLRLAAGTLVVALCATSYISLSRYYGGFVKSPEAIMADQIAAHAHPGDIVLGDAYSVDAALRFYSPGLPVYSFRRAEADGWVFAANGTVLMEKPPEQIVRLDELVRSPRVWLLHRRSIPQPYVAELLAYYQVREEYEASPFRAQLLERLR